MPASYEVFRCPLNQCSVSDILQWQSLLLTSTDAASAFLSPEFCRAVDDVQGGVEIVTAKVGEKLVAILPLQIGRDWTSILGLYTQVGSDISDYFQVIEVEGLQIDVPQMLRRAGIFAVYYSYAPRSLVNNKLPLRICTSTYRLTAPTRKEVLWDIAFNSNRKFWNDAARCERRIEKEVGPIEFLWHEPDDARLGELIKLKLAQYSKAGKISAPLFRQDVKNILDGLLKTVSCNCRGVLSSLSVKGEVLALHFGLQTRNHLHYWFPVYSPKHAKYSPGKVLLMQVIKSANLQEVTSIDFGEGAADYKIAAANETEELGKSLLEVGWRGRVAAIPKKLSWRLEVKPFISQ